MLVWPFSKCSQEKSRPTPLCLGNCCHGYVSPHGRKTSRESTESVFVSVDFCQEGFIFFYTFTKVNVFLLSLYTGLIQANPETHQAANIKHTLSPVVSLESPVTQTCMFLDCGEETEVPRENQHTDEKNIQTALCRQVWECLLISFSLWAFSLCQSWFSSVKRCSPPGNSSIPAQNSKQDVLGHDFT